MERQTEKELEQMSKIIEKQMVELRDAVKKKHPKTYTYYQFLKFFLI